MRRSVVGKLGLALALLGCLSPGAAPGADVPGRLSERALAHRIDRHVSASWRARKVTPAPLTSDAEFVRRVYLDLTGRIPDILEARDFLDNPAKDKRDRLIDQLLAGERFASHFANVYRAWWIPETNTAALGYSNAPVVENWLRTELKRDTGYDRLVSAVLTGRGVGAAGNVQAIFLQAHGPQAENQAAATARLFLGLKLECAQCHNHPFARWSRKQFWEFAAFFHNGVTPDAPAVVEALTPVPGPVREIQIPGTDKKVQARFPDGQSPRWAEGENNRAVVANWLTKADNPFFARAAVNRLWDYLLGAGIVDPVDDAGGENPPSHPELLDELATQFARHDFSVKYLVGAIVRSQAYQLASRTTDPSPADPQLFARMRVRGLSPEQLYDSLALATDKPEKPIDPSGYVRPGVMPSARQEFLLRFPNQDRRTDQKTSILQALYLMNGKMVADAVSLEQNKNLAIIAEATSVRTSRRIEQLYLITLSRKPRPEELARLVRYVDKGGPSGNSRLALCDVFWALLNSSEFCVNH